LTGFGIYLGRFLRFNSWDILQHPEMLIDSVFEILIYPTQHLEAWAFTFCFGVFIGLSYYIINR